MTTGTLEQRLRLGSGFGPIDRRALQDLLGGLEARLRGIEPDQIDLVVAVKGRHTREQRVTLECRTPRWGRLVATSDDPDLRAALSEVRDGMARQLEQARSRQLERRHPNPLPGTEYL
ncbi:MAG: HPF/RaiA family ribosome-associated protein [Motilibacteraceae bacterium]